MTSVLRQLQAEWNTLVPAARDRGIPRVRLLNLPLETIAYRRQKLEWLKAQLGVTSSLTSSALSSEFDGMTFGVELEFLLPRGRYSDGPVSQHSLAARLTEAGVLTSVEVYGHSTPTNWKIVTDGSLTGRMCSGYELVSPILKGEAGLSALAKACDVLQAAGCKINKTCGFHVHVGARSHGVSFFRNLVKLYAAAEPTIDSFLAPSRRGHANRYCMPVRFNEADLDLAQSVDEVAAAVGQGAQRQGGQTTRLRHRKLNLAAFWRHGTVEFRHHQGTVDGRKAGHWVRLVLRMCLAAAKGEKRPQSFDDLMLALEAPESEKDYFQSRIIYFNRPTRRAA